MNSRAKSARDLLTMEDDASLIFSPTCAALHVFPYMFTVNLSINIYLISPSAGGHQYALWDREMSRLGNQRLFFACRFIVDSRVTSQGETLAQTSKDFGAGCRS